MYRLVFKYGRIGASWTEAWVTTGSQTDIDIPDLVSRYNDLRLAMLPSSCQFLGCRVSFSPTAAFIQPAARRSTLLVPGDNEWPSEGKKFTLKTKGTFGEESAVVTFEQTRSCLELQLGYPDARTTTRYLVGVSDDICISMDGTLGFSRDLKWKTAFDSWRAFVKANLGVVARSLTSDDPVLAVKGIVRQAAPGNQFGIIFGTPTPFGWTQGDLVAISGFRRFRQTPGPSINGHYHADTIQADSPSAGFTTVYLRELTTVATSEIKVLGVARRVRKVTLALARISPVRLGIHKRGNSSSGPRGRRLTRVSLDP